MFVAPSTPCTVKSILSDKISSWPSAEKLRSTLFATVTALLSVTLVEPLVAATVSDPSCDRSVEPFSSVNGVALFCP